VTFFNNRIKNVANLRRKILSHLFQLCISLSNAIFAKRIFWCGEWSCIIEKLLSSSRNHKEQTFIKSFWTGRDFLNDVDGFFSTVRRQMEEWVCWKNNWTKNCEKTLIILDKILSYKRAKQILYNFILCHLLLHKQAIFLSGFNFLIIFMLTRWIFSVPSNPVKDEILMTCFINVKRNIFC
jgi:hypothetical protein